MLLRENAYMLEVVGTEFDLMFFEKVTIQIARRAEAPPACNHFFVINLMKLTNPITDNIADIATNIHSKCVSCAIIVVVFVSM